MIWSSSGRRKRPSAPSSASSSCWAKQVDPAFRAEFPEINFMIGNCGTTGTAGRTTLGRLAIALYGWFDLSASTPFAFPGRQAWMLHLILPERVGQRSKELLIV
jgi:hypothetical protein